VDNSTQAYREVLGSAPDCAPGDTEAARRYLDKIAAVLAKGGLTRSDRSMLYRMRDKWQLRADGKDPRFNVVGTRPGRLAAEQENRIRELNAVLAISGVLKQAQAGADLPDALSFARYGLDTPAGYAKGHTDSEPIGGNEDPPYDDLADPADHTHAPGFSTQGRRFLLTGRPKDVQVTDDSYFFVAASDKKGGKARLQCTIQPLYSRAVEEIVRSGNYGTMRTHGDFFRWAVARAVEHLQNLVPDPRVKTVLHQAWVIDEIMLNERMQQAVGDFIEQLDRQMQTLKSSPGGTAQSRQLSNTIKGHIDQMPDGFWKQLYLSRWQDACGHLFDSKRNDGVSLTEFKE
jgi:hypothetical protein